MKILNKIKNYIDYLTYKPDPSKFFGEGWKEQWVEDITKTMCDLTIRIEEAKRKHAR